MMVLVYMLSVIGFGFLSYSCLNWLFFENGIQMYLYAKKYHKHYLDWNKGDIIFLNFNTENDCRERFTLVACTKDAMVLKPYGKDTFILSYPFRKSYQLTKLRSFSKDVVITSITNETLLINKETVKLNNTIECFDSYTHLTK